MELRDIIVDIIEHAGTPQAAALRIEETIEALCKKDLEWACRRLVYAKDTYPDCIGEVTMNRIKRIKKQYNLQVVL